MSHPSRAAGLGVWWRSRSRALVPGCPSKPGNGHEAAAKGLRPRGGHLGRRPGSGRPAGGRRRPARRVGAEPGGPGRPAPGAGRRPEGARRGRRDPLPRRSDGRPRRRRPPGDPARSARQAPRQGKDEDGPGTSPAARSAGLRRRRAALSGFRHQVRQGPAGPAARRVGPRPRLPTRRLRGRGQPQGGRVGRRRPRAARDLGRPRRPGEVLPRPRLGRRRPARGRHRPGLGRRQGRGRRRRPPISPDRPRALRGACTATSSACCSTRTSSARGSTRPRSWRPCAT